MKPVDPNKVDVLKDPAFQASLRQCRNETNLDTDRLANLWQFAQLSGPGVMLEVGSWHGGGALHIANAEFMAPRLASRSYVLLDDYKRDARGVDVAVDEFLERHPSFRCVPLFPGQGVLFSKDLV